MMQTAIYGTSISREMGEYSYRCEGVLHKSHPLHESTSRRRVSCSNVRSASEQGGPMRMGYGDLFQGEVDGRHHQRGQAQF